MNDLTILLASDGLCQPVEHIAEHAFRSFFPTDHNTHRFLMCFLPAKVEKKLSQTDRLPKNHPYGK